MNKEIVEGKWIELKGKAKKAYGSVLNDADLKIEGNLEQIVGIIHKKTGEAKEQIEKNINNCK